jgi:SAM-dependent methyltransferase
VGTPKGGEEYAGVAELYDHVVPYRERKDVAFFVEQARGAEGPVLELGCGSGRVLVPTARAGVEIVGLDSSPAMLSVCREKLAREPAEVRSRARLVEGDMRRFELGRTFALVTIPFRPFQHLLTVEDELACLAGIQRHLAADGRLVLDLFNPSLPLLVDERGLEEGGEEPEFAMEDGRRVIRRLRTVSRDLFSQVLDQELVYYVTDPGGNEERIVHRFRMRYLFRFEAEHLLARAGFRVEAVYGDFAGTPYGETGYPGELILVAKRT